MRRRFLKRIWRGEKGITGLETAIILIAFVVVASVFAYTALSAGLFSTQKSQEAVYSGLEEAQSTLEVKGSVIASGKALLSDCDYIGWVGDTDATLTRETTTKWEGSGSLKVVIGALMSANDTAIYHDMQTRNLTNGDTVIFWIKADAALDSDMTFAIGTGVDLQGTATETYVINTAGTGWEKHSFDLTSGDDDSAAYFGIYLSTDDAGTFYLDNVIFEDIASQSGLSLVLDSCDYIKWVPDTDLTLARETTEKMEGTGSLSCTIGTDMALNDTVLYHTMAAKDWTNGDTITFWVKAAAALDSNITFAIGTTTGLQASATQTQLINPTGTGWEKHTMTLSGGDDDSAVYYGIYLSTDAEGLFYLDGIEVKASLAQTDDPMVTFANQAVITLANASSGAGIDFTTTSDADGDGIISDESTKSHKVTISYNDGYQQITDLAWTKTAIGKDDNDNILENSEKFQVTVDLTNVNNNADWSFEKVGAKHTFTLEIKSDKGAVLVVERTMPGRIKDINNLN